MREKTVKRSNQLSQPRSVTRRGADPVPGTNSLSPPEHWMIARQRNNGNRFVKNLLARTLVQRKCACGGSTNGGGSCAECEEQEHQVLRSPAASSSLASGRELASDRMGFLEGFALSNPGDQLEQQAELVADLVLRMPDPVRQNIATEGSTVQAGAVSRFASPLGGGINTMAATSTDRMRLGLRGDGAALSSAARSFFEPRFGRDFSDVRVHTNDAAARSARALEAVAYTVGPDVVFSAGQYQPDSIEGRKLLAHELAHVVQQGHSGELPHRDARWIAAAPSQWGGGALMALRDGFVSEIGGACQASTLQPGNGMNGLAQLNLVGRVITAPRQVQRRLVAWGKTPDVNALLGLLGPPAGLTLSLNVDNSQVQIDDVDAAAPRSPSLRSELRTIINHPIQDAEIAVARGQPGVQFGDFPQPADLTFMEAQRIDIDDILAIEASAPGNGVAIAAREIQENFVAHAAVPKAGTSQYPAAHRAAVEAESNVATELVGPGRRIAESELWVPVDYAGESYKLFAEDFESYYLVYKSSIAGNWDYRITNVRRVPSVEVSSLTIYSFGPGSAVLPPGASTTIVAAAAAVAANPLSTVLIEGFSDAPAGSASMIGSMLGVAESVLESQDRADAVQEAIHAAGVDSASMHSIGRGPVSFVATTDPYISALNRRVVITIRRPENLSELLQELIDTAPLVATGVRSMGDPQSARGDKRKEARP
jgi:outer membrane protein OmpA-like peptidoglycan-associated protein